jgi:excisionase family DNA binding protein
MDFLTTSDAARILGLSPDMVRHLERAGRLRAERTPGGWRFFARAEVERLRGERETR